MTDLAHLKQKLLDNGQNLPIYLDYQATTPMDPRAVETMLPYFSNKFGNPNSRSHAYGWEAEDAVAVARTQIAKLIGAIDKEIVFTSGATESNNIAIRGLAYFHKGRKNHIITLQTEHKCVINICRQLEQDGFTITYLPVQANGLVDLQMLENSITEQTLLVSIMAVNNEIGVIQPLKQIGELCRQHSVYFHSDIAQAYGKIPINVDECNIDLASISAHKIYGPKGVGALYIRKKPRIRLQPIISGGGQERGLRSGTLPTALIVGFGKAAELASQQMDQDYQHIKHLADKFLKTIIDDIPEVYLNGDLNLRYPGNINLSFAYVEGESMILAIKELAVSSGSACTSASLEPSYVLKALGLNDEMAHTSIRFGIGRFTTEAEIDYALALIKSKVTHLRHLSPLWEMFEEGIDLNSVNWVVH